MKKKLLLLLIALAGLLPVRVAARDFTYTYEGKTITYTVIDEVAKTCKVSANQTVVGEIILPANPLDAEVSFSLTEIGDNAFSDLSELTQVVIPESVTKIGSYAFSKSGIISLDIPDTVIGLGESLCRGCGSLKLVSIGKSVVVIPKFAFLSCTSLEEISLHDDITTIDTQAFSYCSSLKSFTIPDSTYIFGGFPFWDCDAIEWIYIGSLVNESSVATITEGVDNLKEFKISEKNQQLAVKDGVLFNKTITTLLRYPRGLGGNYNIPSTVEIIGEGAFQGSAVSSVEIPNSVVAIGRSAFNFVNNLESIKIPASVKEIGENGFYNCLQLSDVTIKGNLPILGKSVFGNCPKLNTFSIDDSNYAVKDKVLFNKDLTILITCIGTMEGEYKIPETVTEITDGAFYECSELTGITIPSSVTTIGKEAFTLCSALEVVEIPNSVVSIGADAFAGCSKLKYFNIPNSLQVFGQGVLWGCPQLETINIGNDVDESVIFEINETSSVKSYSIDGDSQKYTVKDGVLFNKSMTKLIAYPLGLGGDYVVPSSVYTIGERSFLSSTIRSITIPNSVTIIGENAFMNSNYFTSLIIPESVKEIGSAGFYGCEALESVTIKGSMPVLGTGAFASCDLLKTFIIEDENYVVKDGILFNRELTKLVACFGTTEGEYKIPDTVTEIGGGAFEGSNFTSIEIPSSVVTIGDRAFCSTDNLGSVKIPDSVEAMGESVFLGSGVISVEISNSVTTIGLAAFQSCFKLESIKLGDSITSINGSAFMGSKNLKKVYASSIESWLGINFEGQYGNPLCYGAELIIDNKSTDVVEIPEETQEVSDYAFAGLKNLVEVVISNTV